jgi:cell division protein FtsW
MRTRRNHIDLPTLFSVLVLMVMSVAVVYSASSTWALERLGGSEKLLGSHAEKIIVGFILVFVFMSVDYHRYRKVTKVALLGAVLLLLLTLFLGGEVKGAARWLRIGGFSFQPSELARFALVFHLCTLFVEKKDHVKHLKTGYLPMVFWVVIVTGLVLLQPNFSVGAMIFVTGLLMLFMGRARISHLALTLAALVPLLLGYMLSAPYRMKRVMSFFTGADETARTNYQLWQGIIGFGNGGILGVGPGESRQRDLFLPESYGDFVFSIVGEEYGLIGTVAMTGLFLVILLRGIKIAKHAKDDFGRYLAVGITLSITLYAVVNAGVTLGLLPTTGLPMPFVSYGGSAIVFSAIAIGVLLNISSQTDMHPRLVQPADSIRPADPAHVPAVGKVY